MTSGQPGCLPAADRRPEDRSPGEPRSQGPMVVGIWLLASHLDRWLDLAAVAVAWRSWVPAPRRQAGQVAIVRRRILIGVFFFTGTWPALIQWLPGPAGSRTRRHLRLSGATPA